MAKQQAVARKPSRSRRDKQQKADAGNGKNAPQDEVAAYEKELAGYLQERIRPGLNRGAIPLLARSIAKEIAHRDHPNGASQNGEAEDEPNAEAEYEDSPEADDEPSAKADYEDDAEADDEVSAEADYEDDAEDDDEVSAEADYGESGEADDEDSADADDEQSAEAEASAFEDELHELQADLGEDWILRYSVQGDDVWLIAEKEDGSQHVEAPTADVLVEAVELLNEGGGRSS